MTRSEGAGGGGQRWRACGRGGPFGARSSVDGWVEGHDLFVQQLCEECEKEKAMLFTKVVSLALAACTAVQGMTIGGKPNMMIKPYKREVLQDIVTWDEV